MKLDTVMKRDAAGKPLDLQFFAEGAAGEGGEAGNPGAEAAEGAVKAGGRYKNVQTAAPKAEAGDRDAEFEALTKGEYREAWQKRTDAIIGRRFAELKTLRERDAAMAPLITSLEKRYNIEKGDVQGLQRAIQEEAAQGRDKAQAAQSQPKPADAQGRDNADAAQSQPQGGKDAGEAENGRLAQLKESSAQIMREQAQRRREEFVQAQRQKTRQISDAWQRQTEEAQKLYPGLDVRRETENPEFRRLIFSGVPIRHAFEVTHRDEILGGAMAYTAQKTRERLAQDIAARGLRPQENGLTGQAAQIPAFQFEHLSRAAKLEIERRAMRGERVNPRDYMDYK